MTLSAGTRLGPYEVLSPLGAGGMGEVYKARDTRLDREVAVKVLPEHLSTSPELRQRFEREARAISQLTHPHICTLHDVGNEDGVEYLVMELLEGESLAGRLLKGPLSPEQVIRYGIEIAEALEAAHRLGIIHRDLKPGNVMLTKSGVKLLDFGLAKQRAAAVQQQISQLSSMPTEASPVKALTEQGTIMGTFEYMAPEQLEGKEADARTDIFAFGCVLFEMATGKKAFTGKSRASLIGSILKDEPPPVSSIQPMTPPALDRLVQTCLAKEPEDRFQTAHDARLQLLWIAEGGSRAGTPAVVVARRKGREKLAWGGTALFALVAALFATGYFLRTPRPAPVIVSEISSPVNTNFAFSGDDAGPPVISPDGRRLAFAAIGASGNLRLWVRSLDSAVAQPLEGTDGATFPFWSPDSRSVGFFANGKLNRIDASGGPAISLADAPSGRGGSWGRDDAILFTQSYDTPIFRVPASGGTPQPVTKLNASLHETTHRWPQWLPDGKHFLFYAHGDSSQENATFAGSLSGGAPKLLIRGDSNAVYAPPGDLLFVRQGTLMAQRFDAGRLRLIGEAMPLAEHAATNASVWRGIFTVSANGILAYKAGDSTGISSKLVWFDRNGKQLMETGTPGEYDSPSLSPDDRRLAVALTAPGAASPDIWIFDLARGIRTRLTFSPAIDAAPSWSPDGKTIAFQSNRSGQFHLYQKASDGTSKTTPLVVDDAIEYLPDLSSDGRYLLYERVAAQTGSRAEIWALPLVGDRKAFPVVQNPQFDLQGPALSPDGKWLSYTSSESGRMEIYVVPFGHGGGKWEVSTGGGSWPEWRHDGKELFYLSPDNKIMAAEISEQGAGLVIGKVTALFQLNAAATKAQPYAVSADGQKFVVISQGAQQAVAPLTLVTSWPALLKRK